MATCEDCIHYPLCSDIGASRYDNFDDEFGNTICTIFKDKSKFIELPCAIGDTVYKLYYNLKTCNNCIAEYKTDLHWIIWQLDQFGKTIFLTLEDAQKKLEELK